MKTIVISTDYSDTSKNAAIYAVNLASQLHAQNIILYNGYQAPPVITENTVIPTTSMTYYDIETFQNISKKGMEEFKESISNVCPEGINIETQVEYAGLDNYINELCKNKCADLLVMGVTPASRIEEALIGSAAVNVVKNTTIPVIVVPSEARYTAIRKIMLASDFKNVAETTPVHPIKSLLEATKAQLHIVNIYDNDKENTTDKAHQQELLHSVFKEYKPQFHFLKNESFINGINDFADINNIDLIITIPKKHGFFEALIRESHTKKLAFHSHIPLMYVHEGDL